MLIPEIVNRNVKEEKNLNIELKQTNNKYYYSKKNYNNIDNSQNTETNINKNSGLIISFIKFLFSILKVPFIILIKIYYYVENKKPNNKLNKRSKFYNKWLKKHKSIYISKDEIY